MTTSNAPLHATVDMVSEQDGLFSGGANGTFSVIGRTSNGPVKAFYKSSPSLLSLSSNFTTTNGRIDIALPAAFEGVISGKTTYWNPTIDYSGDIDDPTGEGRHRSFEKQVDEEGVVKGQVKWDGDRHGKGTSEAITTWAPISISV